MEKLKNILSPGHRQDDDALYGSQESANDPSRNTGNETAQSRHTSTAIPMTSTMARADPTHNTEPLGAHDNTAQSRHASTAIPMTSTMARADPTHNTEPLGAHGNDGLRHGEHGAAGTGYSSGTYLRPGPPAENASTASIKSGVLGYNPSQGLADPPAGDMNKPLPDAPAFGAMSGQGYSDRTHGTAGTGREFPLSGGSSTGHTTGSGIGGTTAGEPELVKEYKAMALDHSHGGIGHQYRGERMQPPEPAPHFTRGPHVTDTANRLDPRIAATPIIGEPQPLSSVATEIIGARSTATDQQGYGRDSGLAGASTIGTSTGYGSTTHSSDLANRADPRVDSDRDDSRGMGATSTGAGYGSTTSGPHSFDSDRDGSRLAGGATTGAGYGGTTGLISKAKEMLTGGGKSHEDTTSSSYDSTSRSTTGHDTSGSHSSSLANRADPPVDSDRDGSRAMGAGTTSTGYDSSTTGGVGLQHRGSGARGEPTAQTSTPRITEPHRSEMMNRMDPRIDSTPSATGQSDRRTSRDAALAGGAGAAGAAAYGTSRDRPHHEHGSPMTGSHGRNPYSSTAIDPRVDATPRASQATTSRHGRDAALAGGAGAAGLGAGAYAASRGSEPSPRSSYDNQRTAGQAGYNTYQDPRTASIGAAGAAGGAEYSKREAEKAEAERIKAEQAHQKELAKEQRHHEKEVAKLEKEEEKHEKEARKAAHKHDDGKDSTDKEKHHGLLGLFRRNKDEDQTTAADPAAQRYQREMAGDPTTNVKSVADPHAHDHDRNLAAAGGAAALPQHQREGPYDPTTNVRGGADPSRHDREGNLPGYHREGAGDPTTNVKSVADPHAHDHDRNRLHKDPPPGYAGGTTDTDAARASSTVPLRQHVGTDGPIGDSSRLSGERGTAAGTDDGIVIEPITGFPMNVGKYGSGYGGTDGNPVIEGYNGDSRGPSVASGAPTGSSMLTGRTGADYDNTRRDNAPY